MATASSPHRAEPLTPASTAITLLTVALWGGNPVATAYSLDALPPVTVSGLRFLMATAVMVLWCWLERARFGITAAQWRPVLIAGTLLFLQIGTFTLGTAWTSSSHSSLLVNTFVFWVVAIEHFITRTDRLTSSKAAGLLLAGAGVVALLLADEQPQTAQHDPATLAGDLVMLLSAFLFAVKFVYTKVATRVIGPTELMLWHDVVAVAQFAVVAVLWERPEFHNVDAAAWWGLVYQGVLVGGVCFGLQAHLLKRHSASAIAVFSFLTPLFGILLGVWLRGDQLSSWLVASSITIAAGIYVVNRR